SCSRRHEDARHGMFDELVVVGALHTAKRFRTQARTVHLQLVLIWHRLARLERADAVRLSLELSLRDATRNPCPLGPLGTHGLVGVLAGHAARRLTSRAAAMLECVKLTDLC